MLTISETILTIIKIFPGLDRLSQLVREIRDRIQEYQNSCAELGEKESDLHIHLQRVLSYR